MKILIWVGGLILESFILVLLGYAGFNSPLVMFVMFAIYIFTARYLCKKWDQHVKKKGKK